MEWMVFKAMEAIERQDMKGFIEVIDSDGCEKHYPIDFYKQPQPGPTFSRCHNLCQLRAPDVCVHCCIPECLIFALLSRFSIPGEYRQELEYRKGSVRAILHAKCTDVLMPW